MSQGGTIAYHLRPNKAIDRNLFIDLLARVGRYCNISEYTYIGFGGPFLEDYKQLHAALRIQKMISVEVDNNVYLRQKFNMPISCIELRHQSSSEFMREYDFPTQSVVWFDFTSPSALVDQLNDIQDLVANLSSGDVFKVTVNASPSTLGNPPDDSDLKQFRAEQAKIRLGEYAPDVITPEEVANTTYPRLLLQAVERAAKRGIRGNSAVYIQPLTAFLYRDGQQMLTATGIVLRRDEKDSFFSATRLDTWPFSDLKWAGPRSISVPEFSAKERLHVESLLPDAEPAAILDNLHYYVGEDRSDATALMENFKTYYRMYPWFSRVVL